MQTASSESSQISNAKTAVAPRGAFSQPPPAPTAERRELPVVPQGVFDKRD
ncbi:MAG TPA: hypothetical protein VJV78_27275 [Polyangiales bacterium]|nr:hypothetical protein [Polyangiales bacterium]